MNDIRKYMDVLNGISDLANGKFVENAQRMQTIPRNLYHGTGFRAIVEILATDAIIASQDDNDMRGTFTSDRIEIAQKYAMDAHYRMPDGGVIILNARKIISAGYDIVEYQYYEGDDGKEFVIQTGDRDLHPASIFISGIVMSRQNYETVQKAIRQNPLCMYDEYAWEDGGAEAYHEAVGRALRYPFILS
jgi:hypothetical protein